MTLTRSLDKRGGFIPVFLWQLRRTLPAAIVYWVMMALLTFWCGLTVGDSARPTELLIIGFAVALPMVHLGDCFSRRQADFIHALSVSRGSFYLSALLNALWQILLPIIPCRLFAVYMTIRRGAILYNYHIRSLALAAIAILCFMFLAAAVSGTYHGYMIGAIAHLAGWRIIVACAYFVISGTIPGTNITGRIMDTFMVAGSPVLIQFMNFDPYLSALVYIWLLVFGAVCAALGYVLYKRRKSEQAGHFGKCRSAELFLRTELTLCLGMLAAGLIPVVARDLNLGGVGIPLTLGGTVAALLLAYIILELAWHHSLKAVRSHAVSAVVSVGMIAVFIGAVSTGLGLDDNIPEISHIAYVELTELYPHETYYVGGYYGNIKISGMKEDEGTSLISGVYSLEMLDTAQELNAKYIELERAAQYPYLPGRAAYSNQAYINVNYGDAGYGYKYNTLLYSGPVNERTRPLLEEFNALRDEIMTSEEYINSIFPLTAVDAAVSLDVLDDKGRRDWSIIGDSWQQADPRPKEELPESFTEDLEAALREDFRNFCYPTMDEVAGAEYPVYHLIYDGVFTARGGLYWDIEQKEYLPAEGVEFELRSSEYNGYKPVFRVTKEMPATYAYLEEVYK